MGDGGPGGLGEDVDRAARRWLGEQGARPATIVPLAGDVSARRYYRVEHDQLGSAVFALYPPSLRETCQRFVETDRWLERAGGRGPRPLAVCCERGWMLLEDLGPTTLYDLGGRPWAELEPFFELAVDLAGRIAELPAEEIGALNPPLDRELLARELAQTWDLLLAPRELLGPPAVRAALATALEDLIAALAKPAPRPCHRDFMARNLVPSRGAAGSGDLRIAVLDHQDLRLGPPFYDLASLLNDSLFPPAEIEDRLVARAVSGEADVVAYRRAAAQRTLKAAGTFAAFAARGFERHQPLIRPTLARALGHLKRLPETMDVAVELETRWPADAGG